MVFPEVCGLAGLRFKDISALLLLVVGSSPRSLRVGAEFQKDQGKITNQNFQFNLLSVRGRKG